MSRELARLIAGVAPKTKIRITPMGLAMMLALEEGDLKVGELRDCLAIAQPLVTETLDPLKRSGLVEWSRGEDRRHHVYALTPKGHQVLRSARRHRSAIDNLLAIEEESKID